MSKSYHSEERDDNLEKHEKESLKKTIEALYERNQDFIDLPDRVYGLGGAGKNLVLDLLENDWFLVELLKDTNRSNIEFHIIDTAWESATKNDKKIRKIETKLEFIRRYLKENKSIVTLPSVTIEISRLGREVDAKRMPHWMKSENIDRIKEDVGQPHDPDQWWLSESALTENGDMLNVRQGAVRRRSLGKAFYYKADAEWDEFYDKHLNMNADDSQIAIVAGLGGGTGSGMFLDVARRIKKVGGKSVQQTLFAIPPSKKENAGEKANAFAALCELEYLSLSEYSDDPGEQDHLNKYSVRV